jgi:uncharacterized Tic20 family protein
MTEVKINPQKRRNAGLSHLGISAILVRYYGLLGGLQVWLAARKSRLLVKSCADAGGQAVTSQPKGHFRCHYRVI